VEYLRSPKMITPATPGTRVAGRFYIDVAVVADEQRIVGAWLAVLRLTRMHSSFAGTLPRFTKDGTSIAPK